MLKYLANLIQPRLKPDIAKWASSTIHFDVGIESSPRYIMEKSPWHNRVFKWLSDKETEQIFLIAPAQSGKSTLAIVYLAYLIEFSPSPIMICFPNEVEAKAFTFKRVKPTLDKTFKGLPTLKKQEWISDYGASINGSNLWVAWATSEARCRSWPRKIILADETSLYKIHPSFLIERTKTFLNPKILFSTTPTVENEASWLLATQEFQLHRYYQPCPLCGTFQVLTFGNLVFGHCKNNDGTWDYDKLSQEVRYKCKHCMEEIDQSQRLKMIANGYVGIEKESYLKRKSLRITCLDVPKLSWGDCVIKFLESKSNPETLQVFKTQWLAEPWSEYSEGLRVKRLKGRVIPSMPYGIVPSKDAYLLASIDVQHKSIYVIVRAFLEDGRSLLVYCEQIKNNGPTACLNEAYGTILDRPWDTQGSNEKAKISGCAIDSGDNTELVYDFCRKYKHLCYPVKGNRSGSKPIVYSRIDKFPSGKPIPGSLTLYTLNASLYANRVINNYMLSLNEKGAWILPKSVPMEYYNQLECWKVISKNGRITLREKRNNHYFDCEKYVLALNDILKPQLNIIKSRSKVVKKHIHRPNFNGLTPDPIRRNY